MEKDGHAGKGEENPEPSCIAAGAVKGCGHFREQHGSLEKLKHGVNIGPSNSTPTDTPRDMKIYVHPKTCAQMITTALSITAKKEKKERNNPNVH